MDARCTNCSRRFQMRNQRGSRLSDHTCVCGGKYERMGNNTGRIYGESPNEKLAPTMTPWPTWPDQRVYFNTHTNKKGDQFLCNYTLDMYEPVVMKEVEAAAGITENN